jgi:hypothetical protein
MTAAPLPALRAAAMAQEIADSRPDLAGVPA